MRTLIILTLIPVLLLTGCADNDRALTGTWRFVADQQIDSQGNVLMEDLNVDGLLIYTPDGNMSVQLLWHKKREPLLTDSIMQHDGTSTGIGLGDNSWTPEQNRIWIDTYDAYFGEYTVDWEHRVVTHTITGNLRPEKNATEYKRKFVLRGDTLFLKSVDPRQQWQVMWLRKID
ncbi:lipocalin-like domain-containing protein [Chryseolinea lacunae]|uniref:Lipocalin-like domain-containing protein n=1 Tax=Chryseolinea lacunae TaxID=2801331 RepID=A0ABS1L342_9BACT|nr:lipocalin-like domain-containing protein [Chryseolinea lacunae]MBL0745858.1 lipocalin-like domain-containing protein [Chryseolinea lacunae]